MVNSDSTQQGESPMEWQVLPDKKKTPEPADDGAPKVRVVAKEVPVVTPVAATNTSVGPTPTATLDAQTIPLDLGAFT